MNRRVLAAVDDMIFASKIRGAAERLEVTVDFAVTAAAVFDAAKADVPRLIIIDLHSSKTDPFELARLLKSDERLRSVPIVAFFSHVQTELSERARLSGVDHVMPRSAFTRRLPDILSGEF